MFPRIPLRVGTWLAFSHIIEEMPLHACESHICEIRFLYQRIFSLVTLRWQTLSQAVDRFSINVFGVSMAITKNNVKAVYIIPGEPFILLIV